MNRDERVRAVEALAGDLLSYLPQARQPSSTIQAESGLAKSRREPCSSCKARGRVTAPGKPCVSCPRRLGPKATPVPWGAKHGCKPCLACDGSGWKVIAWRKDAPGWDAYAGVPVGARGERPEWDLEQETGRQLKRVSQLLVLWEHPESVEVAWEERRQTMWQTGSFRELAHALRWLERHFPGRFSLFWRIRVYGQEVVLSEVVAGQLAETTLWLSKLMPAQIKVPRYLRPQVFLEEGAADRKTSLWRGQTSAHGLQRAERAEMMRQQRDEGWQVAQIARFHSLEERQVYRILKTTATATAAA